MKKSEPKSDKVEKEKVGQVASSEQAAAPDAEPVVEQVNPLQEKLDEALAQRDEFLKLAQLARAEFDNYRRRNANVRADALDEGTANAITVLLPVMDNLLRAAAIGEEGPLSEGVNLVLRQFTDGLKTLNVTEVPCEVGAPFDPKFHDAILQGPADGEHPAGTILAVLQKGYQFKERILRHSMVQVAQEV